MHAHTRLLVIGGLLGAALLLIGCGPTTYPVGDASCWRATTDILSESLGCFDTDQATGDHWAWDGRSSSADWNATGCEFDTDACPGQYECTAASGSFARLCPVGSEDPGTYSARPFDDTTIEGSHYASLFYSSDGYAYYPACGLFRSTQWGVRTVDLYYFPECDSYDPATLTVACYHNDDYTSEDVTVLSSSASSLSVRINRHGVCGIFPTE